MYIITYVSHRVRQRLPVLIYLSIDMMLAGSSLGTYKSLLNTWANYVYCVPAMYGFHSIEERISLTLNPLNRRSPQDKGIDKMGVGVYIKCSCQYSFAL